MDTLEEGRNAVLKLHLVQPRKSTRKEEVGRLNIHRGPEKNLKSHYRWKRTTKPMRIGSLEGRIVLNKTARSHREDREERGNESLTENKMTTVRVTNQLVFHFISNKWFSSFMFGRSYNLAGTFLRLEFSANSTCEFFVTNFFLTSIIVIGSSFDCVTSIRKPFLIF